MMGHLSCCQVGFSPLMLIPFVPIRTAGQPEPISETLADSPQDPAGTHTERPTQARRIFPLLGGVVSLALAVWAEIIVESKDSTPLSLVLYLVAILLFAISAWFMPPAGVDLPAASSEVQATDNSSAKRPGSRRAASTMWVGIGLAVVLNLISLFVLRQEITSLGGALLWVASLALLLGTGIALHRSQGWPARWGVGVWPQTRRGRWLTAIAFLLLFAAALAARFLLLDQVPFGVNADEGDRAALSIRIVRGDTSASIFDIGWYWIANMYFWLLAQFMSIFGIGYVQARAFSAIAGMITASVLTWLAIRNFGLRVGLLTGAISALLAVLLQFSRFTSEAGPTAMLWTISAALFLEAARTGKWWAWIGAGLSGGFALYFYPTGKLWIVIAALFCLYLLVRGIGREQSRWAIFRGAALAALASIMIMAPFVLNAVAILQNPQVLYLRAQETSIFTSDNPTRLSYYKPEEGIGALLVEQVIRSAGILNQFADAGGTWPTERPVLYGLLAALTLLGLGWSFLRWRDPRFAMIAIWFFAGFVGMVVTVDTPSLQRMSAAIPLLALFPALVLDNMARRVEVFVAGDMPRLVPAARWATGGALVLLVAYLMWGQLNVYFVDYAKMDRWMHPTAQGKAVASQGLDTLVVSLGRQQHMVNSGWVRLMAPDTPRAGISAPGSNLPLTLPADKNLAFMLFNQQAHYLPYLREIYPGGVTTPFTHTTEGLLFTFYRISKEQRQAVQGATARVNGQTVHVSAIGVPPPGISTYPATVTWTAGLRVPRYWNYAFKTGTPGCTSCPGELLIDGVTVLTIPQGTSELTTTLSLAKGDHYLQYTGTVQSKDKAPLLEWASLAEPVGGAPPEPEEVQFSRIEPWQPIKTEQLIASQSRPVGLFAIVDIEAKDPPPKRAEQRRIDRALATCCLTTIVHPDGRPYTTTWTGFLDAPATGVYSMTLFSQGLVDLKLDGMSVLTVDTPDDKFTGASVSLTAGKHQVELQYKVTPGNGGIEWSWIPPGGDLSIVPPSALSPTEHAGVGPPVPFDILGKKEFQFVDDPVEIVR